MIPDLRALYFAFARVMLQLRYLSKGLAIVLFYPGAKPIATALDIEMPTMTSMAVIKRALRSISCISVIVG